jgi:very-short-patch-repair endonuclease
MSTSEFIERAKQIHGNRYGDHLLEYLGKRKKVLIVCSEHGSFWQLPLNHLSGSGCQACVGLERYTRETFVRRARKLYGDRFSYDNIKDGGCLNSVVITCGRHGDFTIRANSFLMGRTRCSFCLREEKQRNFIFRAMDKHGPKFTYDKVEYIDNHHPVHIMCQKHGDFWQKPGSHLGGAGCPSCWQERRKRSTDDFIIAARQIHGDRYDYSLSRYDVINKKILIVCPKHGQFWQLAQNHLAGNGCPHCVIYKGEDLVAECLGKMNETHERQKKFPGCRAKRMLSFDFYLPSRNLLIEFDGVQHYYPSVFGGKRTKKLANETLRLVREHDQIKNLFAKTNGYSLVRIPYWKSRSKETMLDFLEKVLGLKNTTQLL